MHKIKCQVLNEKAKLPTYGTPGAACADLYVVIYDDHCDYDYIDAGETKIFKTGLAMEIPRGFELQVRARSGLASKGLLVANAPGTIDEDYRGEVGIIVTNISDTIMRITTGDRIAQCALKPVYKAAFVNTTELSKTKRGDGGYGHTGMR